MARRDIQQSPTHDHSESLSGFDSLDAAPRTQFSSQGAIPAVAYSTGSDIHLSASQRAYDDGLATHEHAHVVQQNQGRVKSTL